MEWKRRSHLAVGDGRRFSLRRIVDQCPLEKIEGVVRSKLTPSRVEERHHTADENSESAWFLFRKPSATTFNFHRPLFLSLPAAKGDAQTAVVTPALFSSISSCPTSVSSPGWACAVRHGYVKPWFSNGEIHAFRSLSYIPGGSVCTFLHMFLHVARRMCSSPIWLRGDGVNVRYEKDGGEALQRGVKT